MSARERIPRGSVSGPTHRSAPTVLPGIPSTPGGAGGDRAPPLPSYQGAKQRADVGIGPYGEKGKPHRPPWPAEQSICASGHKGWVGHAAEIIPKVSSNLGQSFNRGIAATAPFAQGSLWPAGDEKAGGHIGPPLRGHRSAQQRQAGRDRARPLQKDGEYAEGWGDERTQGRFDIYRAVIGLVSRKAECPE